PPPGPPPAQPPESPFKRYRWPVLGGLAVIAGVVAAVIGLSSSSSKNTTSSSAPASAPTAAGQRYASTTAPVPTNHVTGSGTATVSLAGDQATVTLNTEGLLNGQPHFLHIHAGARGRCPTRSDARLHNGNLAISTGDGIHSYGPAVTSLTTSGDTTPKSIVDFTRYPAVGSIRYTRTITLDP